MKLNKNKGNLQNQLAKMLQAGMENVEQEEQQQREQNAQQDGEQNLQQQGEQNTQRQEERDDYILHANTQTKNAPLHTNMQDIKSQEAEIQEDKQGKAVRQRSITKRDIRSIGSFQKPQANKKSSRISKNTSNKQKDENEERGLNAAQRHEVPDRNAKYAGEPIKSVGCRMPVTLYARMLQYKALNDSQLNRITLNDIIIEAVERFMDANG